MTKRNKIIYWVATSLLALGMLQSGIFAVIRAKEWVDLVTGLGYPVYFLSILGIWKILGVIALLMAHVKKMGRSLKFGKKTNGFFNIFFLFT